MYAEVKQILGTPSDSSWSQVHHFLPKEEKKWEKKGELILLVSLGTASEDQKIFSLGREMLSRFHEEYYGNPTRKPMISLKEALSRVGQEKSQYFENPKEISLLALVIWKNIAYLGIWHQGKILFRRNGKLTTLIQGEIGQVKVASGFIQAGDVFLLATDSFFENIPKGMVTASLNSEDLETVVEVLAPVVHAREKQGNLAAVLAKITDSPLIGPEPSEEKEVSKGALLARWGEALLKRLKKLKSLKKVKLNFSRWLKNIHPKTSALTVALGFLLLLIVSVFLGWQKKTKQKRLTEIDKLSSLIEEKLKTAVVIKNLDLDNSLKLTNEAKDVVEQLRILDAAKADSFQTKIDSLASVLGGEAVFPQLYYDLNLIGENVSVRNAFSQTEETIVLDGEGKRLISLDLEKKSGEVIAGGEKLADQRLVVSSSNRVYTIDDSIYLLKGKKLEIVDQLGENDQIIAADSWLGKLYLLDKNSKQIWKYPVVADGLGSRKAWFKTSPNFDFGSIVDMGIDGHIWLLLESGRIYKFLSGGQDKFGQQLPSGVGKASFLAVAQESEKIVFWDQGKKMIWVFNKKGEFISRTPIALDQISDLTVSPKGDKVFLFAKDKIYLLSIKD